MKKTTIGMSILYALVYSILANSYVLVNSDSRWLFALLPIGLFLHALAGTRLLKSSSKRLRIACHGAVLLTAFGFSVCLSVVYHAALAFRTIPEDYWTFVWSALLCIGLQALLFWNGIVCVYLTSVQLGIKQRVIGVLCGMIPIANLVALHGIVRTVLREVWFEEEKEQLNARRAPQQVCHTRYPLLLVHGVFFRDSNYFNYWGRIPAELEKNGAVVYYGNHPSAASVADSAAELTARIRALVTETGCGKVNIIAHSKGGLDCRWAMAKLDAAPFIASLTTINTPHRGCLFADRLLTAISAGVKDKVAATYNATLRQLGEAEPDFLAAVTDLTAGACAEREAIMEAPPGVFCQSVGSLLPKARSGKFPLNLSYHLVKHFDGPNDGLVSERSFPWGEKYTRLTPSGSCGISHGDMIDLNRQNMEGFDVREFYVGLVSDLKNRGL